MSNFHFGRPKKFQAFPKCEIKKKKKKQNKKKILIFFCIFHFGTFFLLPHFSRFVTKKFPVESGGGDTLPLACYVTAEEQVVLWNILLE